MSKAWSITTTVRNPERLRDFLIVVQPLVGKDWDNTTQEQYQKLLIKNRLYGFGKAQFYKGLTREIVEIIGNIDNELTDDIVDEIVRLKNYNDFAMRGRQSMNPLKKFGFVTIDGGKVKITALGDKLIAGEKDSGDAFLKSFIKWQIPNPASDEFPEDAEYKIVPFCGMLQLIKVVNGLAEESGKDPVGVSKREFSLFVPTLIDYTKITDIAREIINLRELQDGQSKAERKQISDNYRQEFARNFLGITEQNKIDKFLNSLKDYGDNAIRYFRLTKFIRIRGNGYYIDLEPNRHIEIDALLDNEFYKPRAFASKAEYLSYMSDDNRPGLPWQTKEKLSSIANETENEIIYLQRKLDVAGLVKKDLSSKTETDLMAYIEVLRATKKDLQEKDNHVRSQPIGAIDGYIDGLEKIFKSENRPLMLEYLSTMGLHALNDAEEIKPNYPVGDDNEPTSTAPGGMADIECYYSDFNMICEVTMLKGRDQWYNEGQPVMRHLRDFENDHENSYCLFIAPTIHTDTAETFWVANNVGYKGSVQNITPITITQFAKILKALKTIRENNGHFTHDKIMGLVRQISDKSREIDNSDNWIAGIGEIVTSWNAELVGQYGVVTSD